MPKLRLTKNSVELDVLAWTPTFKSLVGKGLDCDIILNERGVSRQHCAITAVVSGWSIQDLMSTNGTYVNGLKLGCDAQLLKEGDRIEVGEATFVVALLAEPEEATEILFRRPELLSTELLQRATGQVPLLPKVESPESQNHANESGVSGKRDATSEGRLGDRSLDRSRILLPCKFHEFMLIERLGGGMGDVYLAKSNSSPQNFAVKFFRSRKNADESDRARFMREIDITLALKHPSLIESFDFGEEFGELYFVMEHCSGGNLAQLLDRTGPLNLRRTLRLMDRVLSGVAHAHRQSIVHRDLKPSNIMLQRTSGGRFRPKVGDFGLAKNYVLAGESGMTVSGSVGGSWRYMPREQLLNFRYVSPQSDVWSLGAILYECLTGKLPRAITDHDNPIKRIIEARVVPIVEVMSDLPAPISRLVMKAIADKPEDRFRDAAQMRKSLQHAASLAGIQL